MRRELLRPGDYNPPPPEIERMFVGFAELRARAGARRAAREIAHPEPTPDLRFDEGSGPGAASGRSGRGRK